MPELPVHESGPIKTARRSRSSDAPVGKTALPVSHLLPEVLFADNAGERRAFAQRAPLIFH